MIIKGTRKPVNKSSHPLFHLPQSSTQIVKNNEILSRNSFGSEEETKKKVPVSYDSVKNAVVGDASIKKTK